MKRFIIVISIFTFTASINAKVKPEPATVIITAGQSNTDGRVPISEMPSYIVNEKYNYCYWKYGCLKQETKGFEKFWPKSKRWAYDAVTYYYIEKLLKKNFYVIKWSIGGTAIDTTCTSSHKTYWSADSTWLANNSSTIKGGRSLLKSFTEEISMSIDSTLSKLPDGYKIKAFLWHQGESDRHAGKRYYDNLKKVVGYVRNFLVKKTGDSSYAHLPFICGTVSRLNKCYSKDVEDAMYRLAHEDNNFYVIDMSDGELQTDKLHFTAKSAEYLGKEMYNRLVKIKVDK
jgi:hypothetical protein